MLTTAGIMVAHKSGLRFQPCGGPHFLPERSQVGLLVVEDLDHLLPAYHFFNIAIQLTQTGLLLGGIVGAAPFAAEADVKEHGGIAPPR